MVLGVGVSMPRQSGHGGVAGVAVRECDAVQKYCAKSVMLWSLSKHDEQAEGEAEGEGEGEGAVVSAAMFTESTLTDGG